MMDFIKKYWAGFIVILCCMICFLAIKYYFMQFGEFGFSTKTANWGIFGDYIGGIIGTILSFFSIILIYATYKNQVSSSILQQFETTFFNLLNNQREILKSLSGMVHNGRPDDSYDTFCSDDYISAIADVLDNQFDKKIEPGDSIFGDSPKHPILNTKEENEKIINEVYSSIYKGKESELGHYFRHLYHIIKYVHESNIRNNKKYVDIIQAQMSDDELYVTFYNCISKYGKEKFLPIIETYSFLENVRQRGSKFEKHCKQFYPNTKFKEFDLGQ